MAFKYLFRHRSILVGSIVLLFLISILIFTVWNSQKAQEKRAVEVENRKITVVYKPSNEPVRATSFSAQGKTLTFAEEFIASDDWLRDFSVDVQNVSQKTVTYVDIGVFVERPEGQQELPPFHFSMTSGNKPATLRKKDTGLGLSPSRHGSKVLRVSIDVTDYESIRASLDRLGYGGKIGRLEVQIEEVGFSDGTLWSLGALNKPDPHDPGLEMSRQQRPGW